MFSDFPLSGTKLLLRSLLRFLRHFPTWAIIPYNPLRRPFIGLVRGLGGLIAHVGLSSGAMFGTQLLRRLGLGFRG